MNIEDIVVSDNLVPDLDEQKLNSIKKAITDQYAEDKESMKPWRNRYDNALKLARMDPSKVETRLNGGARFMMPYLMEAAIDFNARVVMEVLSRDDIVVADIIGAPSEEKDEKGRRITEYSNYKLKQTNWADKTDLEMISLPIVGTTYKKSWKDDVKGTMQSGVIMPDKIIFSHKVQAFCEAPQVVEEMTFDRNYITSMARMELWEIDVKRLNKEDTSFDFLEVQFCYDIDGDGYEEPYIAMYNCELEQVVRIVANFEPEDIRTNLEGDITYIERTEHVVQKILIPDPEGCPMGLGFGILLAPIFEAINTNTRQLVDSGTLQILASNSGLISHGVRPRGNQSDQYDSGDIEMELGVFKQVQVSGANSLRDSVMQFPFAGPSATLFQLMQHLEDAAKRMSIAGQGIEAAAGEAASMYLAKLQQAMKAPNAMIWRVCQGFNREFKCMFDYFYSNPDNDEYKRVTDDPEADILSDFDPDSCDIVPAINPAQGSDWERMARAEAQLTTAQTAPELHNMREVYLDYYKSLGVQDVESILPEPDPNAVDPLQQMQMQYQAMQAEFQNREMSVKEGELALKQMKAAQEMRTQIESMRIEAEKADADRVKTLTEAMKNLAEIADMEEQKALNTIRLMGEMRNGRQPVSEVQPRVSGNMAQGPDNSSLPSGNPIL